MSSGENNAVQENVSRKELITEYGNLLERAQNKDSKNTYVINYYGERGSGLTEFKKELVKEAQKESCTVLELDFSSDAPDPMAALESLRRKLKKKVDFWRCGVVMRGLGRNWEENLRGPGVLCSFLLILLVNGAMQIVKDRWDGALLVFASTVFGALGGVSGKAIVEEIKHSRDRYRLQNKYPNINIGKKGGRLARLKSIVVDNDADEWSPEDKMERQSWLPELFAEDVNEWLEKKKHSGETLCVFIDSYDAHANGDRAGDEWLYGKHGLCRHLKQAVFVIIGHEPLSWVAGDGNSDNFWKEETESEEGAQTNGEQNGVLLCRPIDRWDQDQSSAFLKERGVPNDLCETLHKLTDGWPELLDKWCEMYAPGDEKNDRPEKENENGKLTEEQLDKLRKGVKGFVENHWHVKLSLAVYLMAGMRRWTPKLLECAMWASGAGINDDIEDVMKELSAEGLIAREGDNVYSMRNESIRTILTRNTMLKTQQRKSAYMALMEANTETGAEAAYYLGEGDLWSGEENLWSKELAERLRSHAQDLVDAAKEQTQKPDKAEEKAFLKEREEMRQLKQRKNQQPALYKRIDGLLEKAIKVYDEVKKKAINVYDEVENDKSKLIAMNNRSMYCRFLGRYDEAFALAERVLEECKDESGEVKPRFEETANYAQKNADLAQKIKGAAGAESGEP